MRVLNDTVLIETEDNVTFPLETLANLIDIRESDMYNEKYGPIDLKAQDSPYEVSEYIINAIYEYFKVKKKYIER